jgi:hypothetical protein
MCAGKSRNNGHYELEAEAAAWAKRHGLAFNAFTAGAKPFTLSKLVPDWFVPFDELHSQGLKVIIC